MDATQVHLMVNHLPIIGAFLGLALVLLAVLRRGERFTVQAATLVLALSAAGGVAAYLSGEEAEHAAEDRGVDHDAIEEHEEGGKFALVAMLLAAGVGGGMTYVTRRGSPAPIALTVLWVGASLLAVGTMTRMGLTGRVVGHPATYGANAAAGGAPAGAGAEPTEGRAASP